MIFLTMFLCFLLGQIGHWAKRANLSTQSDMNDVNRIRDWFKFNLLSIVTRFVACFALFMIWYERVFPSLQALPGTPSFLAPVLSMTAWFFSIPVSAGTSLGWGFVSDSLIDWIFQLGTNWLKNR